MYGMVPQSTGELNPLVQSWAGKVRLAQDHKKPFNDVAKQCESFYAGSLGFMWQPEFMRQFVGGPMLTPRFKVTIAKAFELVALFGPSLFWDYPQRVVQPRKAIGIPPELYQALGDPNAQMMLQFAQMEQMRRGAVNHVVAELLNAWLNYTPTEQPGGGLATHSTMGITEALIKGRACLWPKPYRMPGSQRLITGCFYDSVDNLLIDPDATSIHDARWIAQRVTEPTWKVEQDFMLPPGTLNGYGSHESANRQGEGSAWDPNTRMDRTVGKTFDLLTYYKLWSKGGVGGRLAGDINTRSELTAALDQVVGNYAYLCVAPNVPWPLNAHPERLRTMYDTQVRKLFEWPIAYWLDDKWPVALLDFYGKPQSPWPVAPMAPGLGELTFINSIMSMLMNRVWNACRVIWAGSGSLDPSIEANLLSGADQVFLKLQLTDDVKKLLTTIEMPAISDDILKILDAAMLMFDKRTGLSELLYAMNNGGVARSAEDAANQKTFATIRPEYMGRQVAGWQSEAADMEKFCARMYVQASDLNGYFGPAEQYLWNQYISNQDPEQVVREFRATVYANSMRKPDKAKQVENVNQLIQYFGPVVEGYFGATGDPSPINGLLNKWGRAMDEDMSDVLLSPPPPPSPDPVAQQAAELQTQQLQQELEMQQQQHAMTMRQGAEEHRQKMTQQEQLAKLKLAIAEAQARQRAAAEARKPKGKAA